MLLIPIWAGSDSRTFRAGDSRKARNQGRGNSREPDTRGGDRCLPPMHNYETIRRRGLSLA